jgi:hypothetical protein
MISDALHIYLKTKRLILNAGHSSGNSMRAAVEPEAALKLLPLIVTIWIGLIFELI